MDAVYAFVEQSGPVGRFKVTGLFCTGAILIASGLVSAMRLGETLPSKQYRIALRLAIGLVLVGAPNSAYRPLSGSGILDESDTQTKTSVFEGLALPHERQ